MKYFDKIFSLNKINTIIASILFIFNLHNHAKALQESSELINHNIIKEWKKTYYNKNENVFLENNINFSDELLFEYLFLSFIYTYILNNKLIKIEVNKDESHDIAVIDIIAELYKKKMTEVLQYNSLSPSDILQENVLLKKNNEAGFMPFDKDLLLNRIKHIIIKIKENSIKEKTLFTLFYDKYESIFNSNKELTSAILLNKFIAWIYTIDNDDNDDVFSIDKKLQGYNYLFQLHKYPFDEYNEKYYAIMTLIKRIAYIQAIINNFTPLSRKKISLKFPQKNETKKKETLLNNEQKKIILPKENIIIKYFLRISSVLLSYKTLTSLLEQYDPNGNKKFNPFNYMHMLYGLFFTGGYYKILASLLQQDNYFYNDFIYFFNVYKAIINPFVFLSNSPSTTSPITTTSNNSEQDGNEFFEIIKPFEMNTYFFDLVLPKKLKKEINKIISLMKIKPENLDGSLEIPHGILLTGQPGVGKTMIAKAIATEAGFNFIYCSTSSLDDMYIGGSAKKIKTLFALARKMAPCIIFFDEFDSLGSRNDIDSGKSANTAKINAILTELDGIKDNSKEKIFVMAATNNKDLLDPAIVRSGRFDRSIQINPPSLCDRYKLFLNYSQKYTHVAKNIDYWQYATLLSNFVGADIEALFRNATLHASVKNENFNKKNFIVNQNDLEETIDNMLLGEVTETAIVSDTEKKDTAYHEAGHTLVGIALDDNSPYKLYKVTVEMRNKSAGVTHFIKDAANECKIWNKEDYIQRIMVALGGKVAEDCHRAKTTAGVSSDLVQASNMARAMIKYYGMGNDSINFGMWNDRDISLASDEQKALIDKSVNTILKECYEKTTALIKKHRKLLDMIAEKLYEKSILTAAEVYELKEKYLTENKMVKL